MDKYENKNSPPLSDPKVSICLLQIFQQFIDGRLAYLNQGEGFCDERDVFEKECSLVKIGQKAGDHYQVGVCGFLRVETTSPSVSNH